MSVEATNNEEATKIVGYSGLTPGEVIKLTRIALKLRQLDVASRAGVAVGEVINLEKDRPVRPEIKEAILQVLELDPDDEDAESEC